MLLGWRSLAERATSKGGKRSGTGPKQASWAGPKWVDSNLKDKILSKEIQRNAL